MQVATRSPWARTRSCVPSLEPPSTTMISAGQSCRRTDSMAASMTGAELKQGMMIENLDRAGIGWDDSALDATDRNVPATLHSTPISRGLEWTLIIPFGRVGAPFRARLVLRWAAWLEALRGGFPVVAVATGYSRASTTPWPPGMDRTAPGRRRT